MPGIDPMQFAQISEGRLKRIYEILSAPKGDEEKETAAVNESGNHALALVAMAFDALGRGVAALERIAEAQETMTKLASIDVDATIAEGISAGLEQAINEKENMEKKRTPIGGWTS